MPNTLVWGTANPKGLGPDYNGIYLTNHDIQKMVEQVSAAQREGQVIPVMIEHKGPEVGRVVSAWEHDDTLQCLLEIDEKTLEGALGCEFVRTGMCRDLSLGYMLDMAQSKSGVKVGNKKLKEISIVKKGARKNCHIHGMGKYK